MFKLDKPIAIRFTGEDVEDLENLAFKYGLRVSTYCRAILKAHIDEECY